LGQQHQPTLEGERYHVYPDGLRKAQRLINLAARFKLPLITLIDTQGADPGLEAEEQGIGNAIANTLSLMAEAPIPIISVIIGEGGSEGALALGLSDRILMQHYAIYSPISLNRTLGGPYHNPMLDREAAEALMLTSADCLELGIIDQIVPEPEGGAHINPNEAAAALAIPIMRELAELSKQSTGKLLKRRYLKFRRMGEATPYSQEAMTREVELLAQISAVSVGQGRAGRTPRRRASEDGSSEAQISPAE
ncbi:MAG: carboxyl transferase domain-containing protein, partial [Chloroflexota bacterium]